MAAAQIDDPLDAVAVHMGSGFWGLIACPLFLYDKGIVYSGSLESLEILAWNMAGAGAFIGWQTVCGILTFGFLKVRKYKQDPIYLNICEFVLSRSVPFCCVTPTLQKAQYQCFPTICEMTGWWID